MDTLRTQLKNNAEVAFKLLEQDVDNKIFGPMSEKAKPKHLEQLRAVIEISTSAIEEKDRETLQELIIMTSCLRLYYQHDTYMKYVVPKILSWTEKSCSNVFISFNHVKQTELIESAPIMLVSDFYNKLLNIDDLYVKESLSLIESSNNTLLTEELYYAIKNKNKHEFKRCLNERNANISTASRYLYVIFTFKQLVSLWSVLVSNKIGTISTFKQFVNLYRILTSINKNKTIFTFKQLVNSFRVLSKWIDNFLNDSIFEGGNINNCLLEICYIKSFFHKKELTDKNCKELESAVTYVLSYYDKIFKSLYNNRAFCIYIAETDERWIDLCYNGITKIEISDDELDEHLLSTFTELIRISNLDVSCDGYNDNFCSTKEEPDYYPLCLKNNSKLHEEGNKNKIARKFLQKNLLNCHDIEWIKYVFFGRGTKPPTFLLWTGLKRDLTAFISLMCNGRVDDKVWGYFSNHIKSTKDKGIYDCAGPSSTASMQYKKDFAEIFEDKYLKDE